MDSKIKRCILWTPFLTGFLISAACQSDTENPPNSADNNSDQVVFYFDFEDSPSVMRTEDVESAIDVSDLLLASPEKFQVVLFMDDPSQMSRIEICSLYVHNDSLYSYPVSLLRTEPSSPYQVRRVLISDKQDPRIIYFSSVAIGSEREKQMENEKCLPLPLSLPEKDTTQVPSLFALSLINVNSATPEECGYKSWDECYISTIKTAYSINVCGDPCNNTGVDPGHRIGKSVLTLQREEREDGSWHKKGDPQIIEAGEGVLGIFSFQNYQFLDNADERYALSFLIDDAVTITATLALDKLLNPYNSGFWEVPAGAGPCQGYIHLDLCDVDLTKEGPVIENAAWPFYISGPKECPDGR